MIEGCLAQGHVHMLAAIPSMIGVPGLMGCLKREEPAFHVQRACQSEMQVWGQKVLGRGLLCVCRRPERGCDRGMHQAGADGHLLGSTERQGIYEDSSRNQPGGLSGGYAAGQAAIGLERSKGQGVWVSGLRFLGCVPRTDDLLCGLP